ncbi:MAG: kelch repeat-containing protein [Planctomycetaceae bacterium]
MLTKMLTMTVALALAVSPAFAAEPAATSDKNESRPLNRSLRDMPDNSWRNLEPQGQDQVEARMYSGACFGGGKFLYFGGAHRSYPGNDVDLFDPVANAWKQVTEAEMPERDSPLWRSLTGGGGGSRELTPKGRPYIEHTYQQVCWNPERKHFFVVMRASGSWSFDPDRAEWTHLSRNIENAEREPRGSWSRNQVVWDPALKAPVLLTSSGSEAGTYKWNYDTATWERLADLPMALKQEFYLSYVPAWKRYLLSARGDAGWVALDVATGEFERLEAPRELADCESLSYDAANEVVIALERKDVGNRATEAVPWALDVKTKKWSQCSPAEPWPKGQTTGRWASLWYDPDHNVHFLINDVRRDRQQTFDGGVTETWAYRHKRKPQTADEK